MTMHDENFSSHEKEKGKRTSVGKEREEEEKNKEMEKWIRSRQCNQDFHRERETAEEEEDVAERIESLTLTTEKVLFRCDLRERGERRVRDEER